MTAVVHQGTPLPPVRAEEPLPLAHLIEMALAKGAEGVAALEKLVELEARVSARNAAREFADALAQFQADCPPIQRTSTAKVVSDRGGVKFTYNYAELDEIADTIRPLLHALGFSYGWDSETIQGVHTCTCTLRHRNGHSQTARFTCTVEGSPAMSGPQKHASALTFARRYSLVQVLGLTMTDPDPDGKADPTAGPEDIERVEDMIAACEEAGAKIDRVKFLAWLGVETLADLTVAQVEAAMRELKVKADRARAK